MKKRLGIIFVLAAGLLCRQASAASMDLTSILNLKADKIELDQNQNILKASGNIVLTQNNSILTASEIRYFTEEKYIEIEGPIRIVSEEQSALIEASSGRLTDDLENGALTGVRLTYQDNTSVSSDRARLKKGKLVIVDGISYTPCVFCEGESPLWRIKAGKIMYDRERRFVSYQNARMEIKGIPLLYTPYLAHPDPTIKRKTGILPPKFGSSKELGFIFGIPFFWEITPHSDLLLTPAITEQEGFVMSAGYRHRFKNGEVNLQATGTENSDGDFRNYVKADAALDIGENWKLSLNVDRASDQTFLKTYGLNRDPPAWLESSARLERFTKNTHMKVETIAFQDLRSGYKNRTTPYVLPRTSFWGQSKKFAGGGSFVFESDFLNLHRDEGDNVMRMTNTLEYRQPVKGVFGDHYMITGGLKGDVYNIDDYEFAPGSIYDGMQYRFSPSIHVSGGIPLYQITKTTTQVFEPVFAFHAAPKVDKPFIPDNDSTDFELDDTNIMAASRFAGKDRIDTNTRIAYGLNWRLYTQNSRQFSAFIGQSYSIDNHEIYPAGSGLHKDFSDIVGRVSVDFNEYLTLSYRFRLSDNNLNILRNELDLTGEIGMLKFKMDFVDLTATESQEGRREIGAEAELALLRYVSVSGFTRNDLRKGGGPIKVGGSLIYEDECFKTSLYITRDYTEDRDYEGGLSIGAGIEFKTLGAFKSQRSLF